MAPLNLFRLKGSTAVPVDEKTEAEAPWIPAVLRALIPLTPALLGPAPPPLARKKLVNGDSPGSLTVKPATAVLREGFRCRDADIPPCC